MKLLIEFAGDTYWTSKIDGVVLVKQVSDIEPLFALLTEQDDTWANYKHLIKVVPEVLKSIKVLDSMCEPVGKTDIWDLGALQSKVPFIIYQTDFGHTYTL